MTDSWLIGLYFVLGVPLAIFVGIFLYKLATTRDVDEAWDASRSAAWTVFQAVFWWWP